MVAFLLKSSVIDRLQHPVHHLVTSRTAVEKRSGDFYGRSRALGHRSWLPQVEAKQLAQLRYPNHRIGWRPNGRFPKCGYPQNHSFLGIFHDKASTLGIPHLCKPSNLCFPPWVWNLDPYTYHVLGTDMTGMLPVGSEIAKAQLWFEFSEFDVSGWNSRWIIPWRCHIIP